jgi:hypothetical protein
MTIPRQSRTNDSTGRKSPAGRAVPALAAVSAKGAVLGLGLAAWVWYDTYSYVPRPHEDVGLLGVGYVVAAAVAVPAGIALVLAGLGWWLGRRGRQGWGVGMTVAALAMTAPLAVFASRLLL